MIRGQNSNDVLSRFYQTLADVAKAEGAWKNLCVVKIKPKALCIVTRKWCYYLTKLKSVLKL